MAAEYGRKGPKAKGQLFISAFQKKENAMNDMDIIEILLVEDNPEDVEITLRAFKKRKLTNKVKSALRP